MSFKEISTWYFSDIALEDGDLNQTNSQFKEKDNIDRYHLDYDLQLIKDGKMCTPKDIHLRLIKEARASLLVGHFFLV